MLILGVAKECLILGDMPIENIVLCQSIEFSYCTKRAWFRFDSVTFLDYQRSITYFGTWCGDNFLHLNISKTKELFFVSSKTQIHPSIDINGEMVERVQHFRYLGNRLDDHLSFNQHILGMYKACQQRLTVLHKLKQLSVQHHLLLLYLSIIEPVLMYEAICFFHMLTLVNRHKLLKIPNLASRIIGIPTPKLSDCITSATTRKAHIILNDTGHPLHRYFILLPSGRRYRSPMCKRTNFSKSFVPTAIRALNT